MMMTVMSRMVNMSGVPLLYSCMSAVAAIVVSLSQSSSTIDKIVQMLVSVRVGGYTEFSFDMKTVQGNFGKKMPVALSSVAIVVVGVHMFFYCGHYGQHICHHNRY